MPSDYALLDLHPVLRKLSGQIIWHMFEEYDADPADIDAFLLLYEEARRQYVATLRAATTKTAAEMCVAVTLNRQHNICSHCSEINGIYIPLDHPSLASILPPYGLGCAAFISSTPMRKDECKGEYVNMDASGSTMHKDFICGDWIFTEPWK